jgi:hypothetical protein
MSRAGSISQFLKRKKKWSEKRKKRSVRRKRMKKMEK